MVKIIKIERKSLYRDGGTLCLLITFTDGTSKEVYIDNRISSDTRGEIFDKYPSRYVENIPSELSGLVKEFLKENPIV